MDDRGIGEEVIAQVTAIKSVHHVVDVVAIQRLQAKVGQLFRDLVLKQPATTGQCFTKP